MQATVRRNPKLPRGKGETVMVIDDEPALAELAQEILADLGSKYRFHSEKSGCCRA